MADSISSSIRECLSKTNTTSLAWITGMTSVTYIIHSILSEKDVD